MASGLTALSCDAELGALGFTAGKSCKILGLMTASNDRVHQALVKVECVEVDGPMRSEGVKA